LFDYQYNQQQRLIENHNYQQQTTGNQQRWIDHQYNETLNNQQHSTTTKNNI